MKNLVLLASLLLLTTTAYAEEKSFWQKVKAEFKGGKTKVEEAVCENPDGDCSAGKKIKKGFKDAASKIGSKLKEAGDEE